MIKSMWEYHKHDMFTHQFDCLLLWRGVDSPNKYPGYDTKHSDGNGSLGNAEYPFIAITPSSILAQNGSNWLGPIDGSNRTKLYWR